MLNPTSLHALRATPDCTSTDIWDAFTEGSSVKTFIAAERSVDHVARNRPESIESVEGSTIIAVQRAKKQCGLAVCETLVWTVHVGD